MRTISRHIPGSVLYADVTVPEYKLCVQGATENAIEYATKGIKTFNKDIPRTPTLTIHNFVSRKHKEYYLQPTTFDSLMRDMESSPREIALFKAYMPYYIQSGTGGFLCALMKGVRGNEMVDEYGAMFLSSHSAKFIINESTNTVTSQTDFYVSFQGNFIGVLSASATYNFTGIDLDDINQEPCAYKSLDNVHYTFHPLEGLRATPDDIQTMLQESVEEAMRGSDPVAMSDAFGRDEAVLPVMDPIEGVTFDKAHELLMLVKAKDKEGMLAHEAMAPLMRLAGDPAHHHVDQIPLMSVLTTENKRFLASAIWEQANFGEVDAEDNIYKSALANGFLLNHVFLDELATDADGNINDLGFIGLKDLCPEVLHAAMQSMRKTTPESQRNYVRYMLARCNPADGAAGDILFDMNFIKCAVEQYNAFSALQKGLIDRLLLDQDRHSDDIVPHVPEYLASLVKSGSDLKVSYLLDHLPYGIDSKVDRLKLLSSRLSPPAVVTSLDDLFAESENGVIFDIEGDSGMYTWLTDPVVALYLPEFGALGDRDDEIACYVRFEALLNGGNELSTDADGSLDNADYVALNARYPALVHTVMQSMKKTTPESQRNYVRYMLARCNPADGAAGAISFDIDFIKCAVEQYNAFSDQQGLIDRLLLDQDRHSEGIGPKVPRYLASLVKSGSDLKVSYLLDHLPYGIDSKVDRLKLLRSRLSPPAGGAVVTSLGDLFAGPENGVIFDIEGDSGMYTWLTDPVVALYLPEFEALGDRDDEIACYVRFKALLNGGNELSTDADGSLDNADYVALNEDHPALVKEMFLRASWGTDLLSSQDQDKSTFVRNVILLKGSENFNWDRLHDDVRMRIYSTEETRMLVPVQEISSLKVQCISRGMIPLDVGPDLESSLREVLSSPEGDPEVDSFVMCSAVRVVEQLPEKIRVRVLSNAGLDQKKKAYVINNIKTTRLWRYVTAFLASSVLYITCIDFFDSLPGAHSHWLKTLDAQFSLWALVVLAVALVVMGIMHYKDHKISMSTKSKKTMSRVVRALSLCMSGYLFLNIILLPAKLSVFPLFDTTSPHAIILFLLCLVCVGTCVYASRTLDRLEGMFSIKHDSVGVDRSESVHNPSAVSSVDADPSAVSSVDADPSAVSSVDADPAAAVVADPVRP